VKISAVSGLAPYATARARVASRAYMKDSLWRLVYSLISRKVTKSSQNWLADSLNPKVDQTKLLGKKEKIPNKKIN
jgi:hypothetical protein